MCSVSRSTQSGSYRCPPPMKEEKTHPNKDHYMHVCGSIRTRCVVRTTEPLYLEVMEFWRPMAKQQAKIKKMELGNSFSITSAMPCTTAVRKRARP